MDASRGLGGGTTAADHYEEGEVLGRMLKASRRSHETQVEILTIPAHRPLKPIYIRNLIAFVDAVRGEKA